MRCLFISQLQQKTTDVQMSKWWFASTKYVIRPGSHCNCICNPAFTIVCAFVYSSRLPAYASVHCGCPSQEQITHNCSLPPWIVGLSSWRLLVCLSRHNALLLCVQVLRMDTCSVLIPLKCTKFRTWVWLFTGLFKVYLAERFENSEARVFSQPKTCFLSKLRLLWGKVSVVSFCL